MRPLRRLCFPLAFALSFIVSDAAWTDKVQGPPALNFFPNRLIGADDSTWQAVQDKHGRLFVGADKLLVFDGLEWKTYSVPNAHSLITLFFDKDGRLWTGASNQLGFFTETPDGNFVFTSVLDHLPAEQRNFQFCWGGGVVDGIIYFICQSQVLRWDGSTFRSWSFPTKSRLYAVTCGDELWFTHLETGLYRITKDGPLREFTSDQLPGKAAILLEKTTSELLYLSRAGITYIGDHQPKHASSELDSALQANPVTSACKLSDGNLAITTLGGLLVTTPTGQVLRKISQADGLPSNSTTFLFIDREKQLWISAAGSGIARVEASGAVSVFRKWGQADHSNIFSLSSDGTTVFASTDSGIFRLPTSPAGRISAGNFVPIPNTPSSVGATFRFKTGLLTSSFDSLIYIADAESIPVLRGYGFGRMVRQSRITDALYCVITNTYEILRVIPASSGPWNATVIGQLSHPANDCYVDSQDNLWLNSGREGVWHFNTRSGVLTQIHDGARAGYATETSQVTGYRNRVYFFTAREGFVVDDGFKRFHRIDQFPSLCVRQAQPSLDGRWLYIVFERTGGEVGSFGLGRLALDAQGEPKEWTELAVPKIAASGVPTTLLLTKEDSSDSVWVGGTEGIVRIKPDEVPTITAPEAPWLRLYDAASPIERPASATYAFGQHHLVLKAGSPQIDQRKDLLFQMRLGDENAPWSDPSPTSTFEFTNLSDGNYRFEVRVVNAAGLVSPSVVQTFRILPPWYRTPWAFGAYAGLLGLGIFSVIRVRERNARRRNQELETLITQRTAELTKANAAKDEFLAGMSHEIRNPMNGVIGLASTIDSARLDPDLRERFTQLRHCATHVSSLLEDILDFSRLQADAVTLNPQPFVLQELTESILAITAAESARARIPVEVAISPAVPPRLIGDAARIRQILLNLVINALKYSGRGTVCVTVWTQSGDPTQADLTFAVSDDGPGIAPEEQARLFTRFERGAAAQAGRVSGTGLGLALCKMLAEKMAGRLWLESEPGQGSTFYLGVRLPIASEEQMRAAAPTAAGGPLTLRALIVDDAPFNLMVLSTLLEQMGFIVVTAENGEAALAAARDGIFDVVFLDVSMPGKSGPEVSRALRGLPHLKPDMPIIATTAFTTTDKRQECLAAGMNAFLTKPISVEKIRSAFAAASAPVQTRATGQAPVGNSDPLAALRLLAERKGTPVAAELQAFIDELDGEARLLAEVLRQRDSRATTNTGHMLVARFTFVQANIEADLAREIEAAAAEESWERAETAGVRLAGALPALSERLRASG